MRERVDQQLVEVVAEMEKLPRRMEHPLTQLLGLLDGLAARVCSDLDGSSGSANGKRVFKAISAEYRSFARSIFADSPKFALGKGRNGEDVRGDSSCWVVDSSMGAELQAAAAAGEGEEGACAGVMVVSEVQQVLDELKTMELPTFFNYR
jgi:hypothetical protein